MVCVISLHLFDLHQVLSLSMHAVTFWWQSLQNHFWLERLTCSYHHHNCTRVQLQHTVLVYYQVKARHQGQSVWGLHAAAHCHALPIGHWCLQAWLPCPIWGAPTPGSWMSSREEDTEVNALGGPPPQLSSCDDEKTPAYRWSDGSWKLAACQGRALAEWKMTKISWL